MQNAAPQYPGPATSVQQYATPETSPNGMSTTSSLRQFRKKADVAPNTNSASAHNVTHSTMDPSGVADTKHVSNTGHQQVNENHQVARVAPHSHYPPNVAPPQQTQQKHQSVPEYMRYQHQYQQDYSMPNQQTKYPDMSDPQQDHYQHGVIQKPNKTKEYLDLSNVQQQHHMKNMYPGHLMPQNGYSNENMLQAHPQYQHKEPQMHHGYKQESQYVQKESAFQQLPHQMPKYSHLPPAAQMRKYPPAQNNDFLSKLSRINPTVARDIMSEHHMQETAQNYPPVDQRYHQSQRYYPAPAGLQATPYPQTYHPMSPHQHFPNYPYNYPRPHPTLRQASMERSASPRRPAYVGDGSISPMSYGPGMPQKVGYGAQYGAGAHPEYAQHYQNRRGLPSHDYYQQCRQTYVGNHQMQAMSDMPESRVSPSDSLKKFIENWDAEDETEMGSVENPAIPKDPVRGRDDQSAETVYMINASDVQYFENSGIPLVTSENGIPIENCQYIIKSGVTIDSSTGIMRLIDSSKEPESAEIRDRVVNLQIMEPNNKSDCMLAEKQAKLNSEKRVVIHQNTILHPAVTKSDSVAYKETEYVDKNCSPINFDQLLQENENDADNSNKESCLFDEEPKKSPPKNMPIIEASCEASSAIYHEKVTEEPSSPKQDNDHLNKKQTEEIARTLKDEDQELSNDADHLNTISHLSNDSLNQPKLDENGSSYNRPTAESTTDEESSAAGRERYQKMDLEATPGDAKETPSVVEEVNEICDAIPVKEKTEETNVSQKDTRINEGPVKRVRRIFSVDDIINKIGQKEKKIPEVYGIDLLTTTKEFLSRERGDVYKSYHSDNKEACDSINCEGDLDSSNNVCEKETEDKIINNALPEEPKTSAPQLKNEESVDCGFEESDTVKEADETGNPSNTETEKSGNEILESQTEFSDEQTKTSTVCTPKDIVTSDINKDITEKNEGDMLLEQPPDFNPKFEKQESSNDKDKISNLVDEGLQGTSINQDKNLTVDHSDELNSTANRGVNIISTMEHCELEESAVPESNKNPLENTVATSGDIQEENTVQGATAKDFDGIQLLKNNTEGENNTAQHGSSKPSVSVLFSCDQKNNSPLNIQELVKSDDYISKLLTANKESEPNEVMDESGGNDEITVAGVSSIVKETEEEVNNNALLHVNQELDEAHQSDATLSKSNMDEDQKSPANVQYRSAIKIEANNVLLEIAGELVDITVNIVNGKKVISVVPLSNTTLVDYNDNYETASTDQWQFPEQSEVISDGSNEVLFESSTLESTLEDSNDHQVFSEFSLDPCESDPLTEVVAELSNEIVIADALQEDEISNPPHEKDDNIKTALDNSRDEHDPLEIIKHSSGKLSEEKIETENVVSSNLKDNSAQIDVNTSSGCPNLVQAEKIDISKSSTICTKAAMKIYDSELQIHAVTTTDEVLSKAKKKTQAQQIDTVTSSEEKVTNIKIRDKKKKVLKDKTKRSKRITDKIKSKNEKKSKFKKLTEKRTHMGSKSEQKEDDDEYVDFKELLRARKLKKLKKLQVLQSKQGESIPVAKRDPECKKTEESADPSDNADTLNLQNKKKSGAMKDKNCTEVKVSSKPDEKLSDIDKTKLKLAHFADKIKLDSKKREEKGVRFKVPKKRHIKQNEQKNESKDAAKDKNNTEPDKNSSKKEEPIESKSATKVCFSTTTITSSPKKDETKSEIKNSVNNSLKEPKLQPKIGSVSTQIMVPSVSEIIEENESRTPKKKIKLSLQEYNNRKRKMSGSSDTSVEEKPVSKKTKSDCSSSSNDDSRAALDSKPKDSLEREVVAAGASNNSSLKEKPINDWEKTETARSSPNSCLAENSGLIDSKLLSSPEITDLTPKPPRDASLEAYKEQVDSKLSSLNIQIPRVPKSPTCPFKINPNTLVKRFLNNEKITPNEMEKIRRIITYKRIMESFQNTKSPEANKKLPKSHTYEVSNDNDETKMKLHLKKVSRRSKEDTPSDSSSDTDCDSGPERQKKGNYSVVQSNALDKGVPKLIIKRKLDLPQAVVKLERLDMSLVNKKQIVRD